MKNRRFTPTYDNDLIPKWFLDSKIDSEIFIAGEVKQYLGTDVPKGWLLCDGSSISRNTYNKLFNIIGTTYGSGDGTSTFDLPTLSNSSTLGYDIIKY